MQWLRDLGVRHLRTGLSWADFYRPDALAWFDRQMAALEDSTTHLPPPPTPTTQHQPAH